MARRRHASPAHSRNGRSAAVTVASCCGQPMGIQESAAARTDWLHSDAAADSAQGTLFAPAMSAPPPPPLSAAASRWEDDGSPFTRLQPPMPPPLTSLSEVRVSRCNGRRHAYARTQQQRTSSGRRATHMAIPATAAAAATGGGVGKRRATQMFVSDPSMRLLHKLAADHAAAGAAASPRSPMPALGSQALGAAAASRPRSGSSLARRSSTAAGSRPPARLPADGRVLQQLRGVFAAFDDNKDGFLTRSYAASHGCARAHAGP